MTWFKVDDSLHSHPKAMAASLAAIGLWSMAGSWSGKHHTDGFIPDHMIPSLARGQVELARELCAAGLWKRSKGGYQFHQWEADGDGTPRNPTREEAMAGRRNMSSGGLLGNHRRWHVDKGRNDPACRYCQEEQYPPPDRPTDRVPDAEPESGANPPGPVPSRPGPDPKDELPLGDTGAGDQSVHARARAREAARWLHHRYRLTDQESAAVIAVVEARAREPIKNLVRYLDRMTEGDLADIVGAAMDTAPRHQPPRPRELVQPPILQVVSDESVSDPYESGPGRAREALRRRSAKGTA